ncbi:glycosyltransferase family 2 protein [Spirosoma sp. KNUC1025]|uniref:glycosyltransferase family 2 protein n=1 Tax=Spirosoma sp. KNUC1025 TaxID=2894082 RepID=UPI00386D3AB1|nr:glycosyltransferase family 2 protein [Spirosoma sp. KNUC1025]
MATFNGASFINEQINSILDQLDLNDELIISDDGSTDSTLQLVNSFNDPRIRLLINPQPGSAVRNFENALKSARGSVIFLSDQDDVWYADKVNIMLADLNSYDLVLTDCQVVDEQGGILNESFFSSRGSMPGFWRNYLKNSYMGCCMAFRRTVLSYILPFPKYIHMHDWWIGLITELQGSTYFRSQPLVHYRRHSSNLSPTSAGSYHLGIRIINRLWIGWYIIKRIFMSRCFFL